ncbi:TetR/AcrR family transcriptional regulator [Nocardioides gansuensis]|uniref:TetR/AcrR family transcriptional regulator n=1 Tax=Nocardioides gansuensis TaxID=2138300 RepID=A0A2T8FDM9_9ACTN|nr:WHG domain-containing protein [Nocardioides gansuensis]PVG83803.1 TetR/AcrR family transcriptional regulator [Nocardioides gansuensis]
MDTSAGTRTQRRAAATRQSIVQAAKDILATHGSAALTIEAVADRADVAVQTIYNRVGGRSALLVAVAELAMLENREYMDTAYATPGTIEERLLLTASSYTRFALERPHEFRLLVEPPDHPEALTRIAELIQEQNNKLAATIRDGIAEGVLSVDEDPEVLATALWAMWNGILSLGWRADPLRPDRERLQQLLDAAAGTMLVGLRART